MASETVITDDIIAAELAAVPASERSVAKLSPTQAGLTADTRDPFHQCRSCWLFGKTREGATWCLVHGAVKEIGTCNDWRFGRGPEVIDEPEQTLGKIESGYMERAQGGFRCGGCLRYDAEKQRCRVTFGWYADETRGAILADWCCSRWTDGKNWVPQTPERES